MKHWALHLWHTATLVGTNTDFNKLIRSVSLPGTGTSDFWQAILLTTLEVRLIVTLVVFTASASVLGVDVLAFLSFSSLGFGKLTSVGCLKVVETDLDKTSSPSSSVTGILLRFGHDLEFLLLLNFSWARMDSTSLDILLNRILLTLLMNLATDSAVSMGGTGFLVRSDTSWSSVSPNKHKHRKVDLFH